MYVCMYMYVLLYRYGRNCGHIGGGSGGGAGGHWPPNNFIGGGGLAPQIILWLVYIFMSYYSWLFLDLFLYLYDTKYIALIVTFIVYLDMFLWEQKMTLFWFLYMFQYNILNQFVSRIQNKAFSGKGLLLELYN